jgi:hypothetical protein
MKDAPVTELGIERQPSARPGRRAAAGPPLTAARPATWVADVVVVTTMEKKERDEEKAS